MPSPAAGAAAGPAAGQYIAVPTSAPNAGAKAHPHD